jgi:hypothetical protein
MVDHDNPLLNKLIQVRISERVEIADQVIWLDAKPGAVHGAAIGGNDQVTIRKQFADAVIICYQPIGENQCTFAISQGKTLLFAGGGCFF